MFWTSLYKNLPLIYHVTKFWLNFDVFPSSTLFLSAKFGILVEKWWYMYLGSFSEGCIQHSTSQCVVVVMKTHCSGAVTLVTWHYNGSFLYRLSQNTHFDPEISEKIYLDAYSIVFRQGFRISHLKIMYGTAKGRNLEKTE